MAKNQKCAGKGLLCWQTFVILELWSFSYKKLDFCVRRFFFFFFFSFSTMNQSFFPFVALGGLLI